MDPCSCFSASSSAYLFEEFSYEEVVDCFGVEGGDEVVDEEEGEQSGGVDPGLDL